VAGRLPFDFNAFEALKSELGEAGRVRIHFNSPTLFLPGQGDRTELKTESVSFSFPRAVRSKRCREGEFEIQLRNKNEPTGGQLGIAPTGSAEGAFKSERETLVNDATIRTIEGPRERTAYMRCRGLRR